MQIFGGIGAGEIIFVLILMVIVLGPKKMVEGARELGKTVRKVTRSQFWKDVQKTSQEIRDIPRKIMNEVEMEEDLREIERSIDPNILQRTHAPAPSLSQNNDAGEPAADQEDTE